MELYGATEGQTVATYQAVSATTSLNVQNIVVSYAEDTRIKSHYTSIISSQGPKAALTTQAISKPFA